MNEMPDLEMIEATFEPTTIGDILPKTVNIPEAVRRFTGDIHKKFEGTANNCLKTADAMRKAAYELEQRAKELLGAAPDVAGHVERWVTYEQESMAREKFLRVLFEGK